MTEKAGPKGPPLACCADALQEGDVILQQAGVGQTVDGQHLAIAEIEQCVGADHRRIGRDEFADRQAIGKVGVELQ